MSKHWKRICATLILLCMLAGFMPVSARAALADGSEYITQQLYLGESLMLHLRGNVDYLFAENAVATLAYGDRVDTYRLEDLTVCSDGQREAVIDLAAAQMTQNIKLTIQVGNTIVLEESYSIRDYVDTLLQGNFTQETKDLCYELLNYGAWAQRYFEHNTGDLADQGYDIRPAYSVPENMPTVNISGQVPGITFYGATVRFLSQTAVRFYFDTTDGVENYTITANGQQIRPGYNNGRYFIEVGGLNPQQMRNEIAVEVTDGTNAFTFAYAPINYFIRNYHKTTNSTFQSLMAAAYSYFTAAEQFEKIGTTGALELTYSTGDSKTICLTTNLPEDTALADFAPTENGCHIDQSANRYQTASSIGMTKENGSVVLRVCFDEGFTEGQTYCLPKNAFFRFTDNSQYALQKDYIFRFNGTDWTPISATGDFLTGIGFEEEGNTLRFSGQGKMGKDVLIGRVAYTEIPLAAATDGGSYALKMYAGDAENATFRIHFGKTLAARTQLTFQAYSTCDQTGLIFTNGQGDNQTISGGQWDQVQIVLPESAEYVDLTWQFTGEEAQYTVYLDTFLAVEPARTENLLLGFESYQEFTGAKIAVGNMLGRMEINTDYHFVSQGNASLKVSPQGDYSRPDINPYFKLDFLDTTCATDDFTGFKSISFDVYNTESEQLHIKVGLVVGDDPDTYLTTIEETFTLKPNGWTTCTYDLSIMAGYAFYDISNVRYMTVKFMEHKESREDVPNVLYIDNLRGNAYAENEGPAPAVYDFQTGIDFETRGHEYLFTGQGIKNRDANIERILYYTNGTVAAPAGGGSYGLRLRHDSNYWPTFRIYFGEVLAADTEITFMAYGRIYGTSSYNQSVFEFSAGGDATKQFSCGQWTQLTMTLKEDAEYIDLFWNFDRANITSETAIGEVYIDNICASAPAPSGDFLAGIGFEVAGNAERFTGTDNASTSASAKRVSYETLGVSAPTNGGSYALKLSHNSNKTPTFRINFGEELPAGTVISFQAYGNASTSYRGTIKFASGESATDPFTSKQWTDLSITLPKDAEYVDLFWVFNNRYFSSITTTGDIYIDNIKAVEPAITPEGDFITGLDFETRGHAGWFTGQGEAQEATIRRVAYSDLDVSAPANGGSYALKVSHASHCWPSFRVNFGETLTAGTTITFDVYGNYDYEAAEGVNKYIKLELTEDSKKVAESADPNQVVWTLVETWKTGVTITLTADTDHVDFFYNVADGQHGEVSSWLLLDNFKAVAPVIEPSGDFVEGIGFETEGNELRFTGTGADQDATIERVSYTNANVTAPANGGSYALKVSHANNCWPSFRVNFGKTLTAGTTITFDVYGNYDYEAAAGVNKYVKLELTADGKNVATSADPNQVVWTLVETWKTGISITLTADCDYVDFFYNVADGQHGDVSSWLLLDNFKAVEPAVEPSGDFVEGVGFETEGNELRFTGTGADQDATIERVSYADANVTAPANGGSYALKVSHASHCWPTFRVNFGKTLPAGTIITFDVYGNYDYEAAAGVNKYVKLELAADSKNYATSEDPNQVVWTLVETWKTGISITLTADTDHVDFFYNVADGSHGEVSSWLLLDNFKAVEP